jgi:hypothetical protein
MATLIAGRSRAFALAEPVLWLSSLHFKQLLSKEQRRRLKCFLHMVRGKNYEPFVLV